MTGTYLLADIPIQITSLYDEVHKMCADYRTELPAHICISTTDEEIEEEGRMSDQQRKIEGLPSFQFEPSYLETLTIYRKIATEMMSHGILLMHGSVIAVDGEAYLFTALSGTGKSTVVIRRKKDTAEFTHFYHLCYLNIKKRSFQSFTEYILTR